MRLHVHLHTATTCTEAPTRLLRTLVDCFPPKTSETSLPLLLLLHADMVVQTVGLVGSSVPELSLSWNDRSAWCQRKGREGWEGTSPPSPNLAVISGTETLHWKGWGSVMSLPLGAQTYCESNTISNCSWTFLFPLLYVSQWSLVSWHFF